MQVVSAVKVQSLAWELVHVMEAAKTKMPAWTKRDRDGTEWRKNGWRAEPQMQRPERITMAPKERALSQRG